MPKPPETKESHSWEQLTPGQTLLGPPAGALPHMRVQGGTGSCTASISPSKSLQREDRLTGAPTQALPAPYPPPARFPLLRSGLQDSRFCKVSPPAP